MLTPLLGQSQHVGPHGLPVRKGPLCSCWLLSVIYPSCYCSKDQSIQLPEACSKKASHLQHARLQAHQLNKPSTSANLRLTAGQCTAKVSILWVGQANLQLRTLAARSMSGVPSLNGVSCGQHSQTPTYMLGQKP